MKIRLIIKISPDKSVLEKLNTFGKVEELSQVLNIYAINIEQSLIDNVRKINGVERVEYNTQGKLQPVSAQ